MGWTDSGSNVYITGGNVGIGTSSPSVPLHISSSSSDYIRVERTGGSARSYDFGVGSGPNVGTTSLAITDRTANVERLVITSAGDVGIGTYSPAAKFAVSNAGAAGIEIDPSAGLIQSYNRSSSAYGAMLLDFSYLQLRGGGTADVTVDTAGSVGIGTDTPAQKLHVNGNIFVGAQQFVGSTYAALSQQYSSGGTVLGYNAIADTANNDRMIIKETNAAIGAQAVRMEYTGGIQFHVQTGSVTAGNEFNSEKMRITTSGAVGIGTTSPTQTLDVRGTVFVSTSTSKGLKIDEWDHSDEFIRLTSIRSGAAAAARVLALCTERTAGTNWSWQDVFVGPVGYASAAIRQRVPSGKYGAGSNKFEAVGLYLADYVNPANLALRRTARSDSPVGSLNNNSMYEDGGVPQPMTYTTSGGEGNAVGHISWQPYGAGATSNQDSYTTSGGSLGRIAQIHAEITQNPTYQARGGKMVFSTTPNNSVDLATRMEIEEHGLVRALAFGVGQISISLSASQNNWNPSGLSQASYIRMTASSAVNITGLAGGKPGRMMVLINVSSNNITLKNNDGASDADNRFILATNSDLVLTELKSVILFWDDFSDIWREASRSA